MLNEKIYCADCEDVIAQDYGYRNTYGDIICESCGDNYTVCNRCYDIIYESDSVPVDGGSKQACQYCADTQYYRCQECEEYYTIDHIAADSNLVLCDDCIENYNTCTHCEDLVFDDDTVMIGYDPYCQYCSVNHAPREIHDYDYRPNIVFFGGVNEGYGVELEIDDGYTRDATADSILAAAEDHIYLKDDGSLSSDGFEIVTHPATLDYHMHHLPWQPILNVALENGYKSHDTTTCGLHIHASRTLFGDTRVEQDLTIAKVMLVMDTYWDSHVVNFSRRDYNQLSSWAKKPATEITSYDDEMTAIQKSKECSQYDRYKAVNIRNSDTVEFRFFRGTLKQNTIIASLQWVDTIIKYCRHTALINLWLSTWDQIFNHTAHAELNQYLHERKIKKGRTAKCA